MPRTISPEIQLDAVSRSLELIWEDGGVSATQTLGRRLGAPAQEVWSALTCPERLAQWFAPVSGTLRVGGHYAVEGGSSGTIAECTPHSRLALTWEYDGATSDVVVEIAPEDGGTRVHLLHVAVISHEMWAQFGAGAGGVGWDLGFLGLQQHLEDGAATPPESTDWIGSEQAREFMAGSSRRWADASIAAGTPTEEARAAGERTTAFYLGGDPSDA